MMNIESILNEERKKIIAMKVSLLSEHYSFTSSEAKVMSYIATGKTLKQCADIMGIKTKTISSHKRSAYRKMFIASDVQFVYLILKDFFCFPERV